MSGVSTVNGTISTSIERLLEAMERLPSQGNVALQVLWMADDPMTSLADLARAVEADPALVARLLHLANSAYYSPRHPITTIERAIMLLGFATVRTIATVVACGLGPGTAVPVGFWSHASAAATAAQLIAWRFGINSGEAFAVGLLHDLGRGLLHVADPELSGEVDRRLAEDRRLQKDPASWNPPPDRIRLERTLFGVTHPEAAARVLRSWKFPEAMVEAIAHHHAPLDSAPNDTTRLLIAAEALTDRAVGSWDEPVDTEAALALLDLEPERLELIVRRVRNESTGLSAVLSI